MVMRKDTRDTLTGTQPKRRTKCAANDHCTGNQRRKEAMIREQGVGKGLFSAHCASWILHNTHNVIHTHTQNISTYFFTNELSN